MKQVVVEALAGRLQVYRAAVVGEASATVVVGRPGYVGRMLSPLPASRRAISCCHAHVRHTDLTPATPVAVRRHLDTCPNPG